MQLIIIPIGLGLLTLAIVLLYRCIYNHRINQKLRADNEAIAGGTSPVTGRNHTAGAAPGTVLFVVSIIALFLAVILVVYATNLSTSNRQASADRIWQNNYNALESRVSVLEEKAARENNPTGESRIASAEVLGEDFDPESATYACTFCVMLSETVSDTDVVLYLDGERYPMEYVGPYYVAHMRRPAFPEMNAEVTLQLRFGDKTETFPCEKLTRKLAGHECYPRWLPYIEINWWDSLTIRTTKKGIKSDDDHPTLEVCTVKPDGTDFTSARLTVIAAGKTIREIDLTELVSGDNDQAFLPAEDWFPMYGVVPEDVILRLEWSDSLGYSAVLENNLMLTRWPEPKITMSKD